MTTHARSMERWSRQEKGPPEILLFRKRTVTPIAQEGTGQRIIVVTGEAS